MISFDKIKTDKEAEMIINCLKSADSRSRSHASDLIYENLYNHEQFFNREECLETLIKAIKYTNPRVCANIKNSLQYLTNELTLLEKLVIIIEECNKDIKKEKNLFNLYWSLYALETLIENLCELEKINVLVKLSTVKLRNIR